MFIDVGVGTEWARRIERLCRRELLDFDPHDPSSAYAERAAASSDEMSCAVTGDLKRTTCEMSFSSAALITWTHGGATGIAPPESLAE